MMNQAIVDRLEALLSAANREIDRLKDRQLDLDGVDCGRCLELTEKLAVLEKERDVARDALTRTVNEGIEVIHDTTVRCEVLKETVASLEAQFKDYVRRTGDDEIVLRNHRDRLAAALAQAVHTFADFRMTLRLLRHEGASQAAGIAEDYGSRILDEVSPSWREKP